MATFQEIFVRIAQDIKANAGQKGDQGPEGPYGGTAVTDPQVASYVTDTATQTSAALTSGFLGREITRTGTENRELLHIVDENTTASLDTVRLEDSPERGGNILNIHHRSTGAAAAQSYGINIANLPGAAHALVIHQYSNRPAVQIDNTDFGTSFIIRNTQNQVMNPGGVGNGTFMQFIPYGQSASLRLLDNLTWYNTTTHDMLIQASNPSIYAFGIRADADKIALQVNKNGTGGGNAATIINKGTGVGLLVSQDGATGTAAHVVNRGTGPSLRIQDATGDTFRVSANGETEIFTPGAGLVLRSPNGARHRVTVSDAGALTTTAL